MAAHQSRSVAQRPNSLAHHSHDVPQYRQRPSPNGGGRFHNPSENPMTSTCKDGLQVAFALQKLSKNLKVILAETIQLHLITADREGE